MLIGLHMAYKWTVIVITHMIEMPLVPLPLVAEAATDCTLTVVGQLGYIASVIVLFLLLSVRSKNGCMNFTCPLCLREWGNPSKLMALRSPQLVHTFVAVAWTLSWILVSTAFLGLIGKMHWTLIIILANVALIECLMVGTTSESMLLKLLLVTTSMFL